MTHIPGGQAPPCSPSAPAPGFLLAFCPCALLQAPGVPKPSTSGLCPPSPLLRQTLQDKVCAPPRPPSYFTAGRKRGGRPPGLGQRCEDQAWSERSSLGKGSIWSLKEPQGRRPGSPSAQAQPQPPSKDSWVALKALRAQHLASPGLAGPHAGRRLGRGPAVTTWSLPQYPNLSPTCPRNQGTGTEDNLETAALWEGGRGGARPQAVSSATRCCRPPGPAPGAAGVLAGEKWGAWAQKTPRPPHSRSARTRRDAARTPRTRSALRRPGCSLGSRAGEGPAEDPAQGPPAACGARLRHPHNRPRPPRQRQRQGRGRDRDRRGPGQGGRAAATTP